MSVTLREKLLAIQNELKAPKNQYNSFGKYNYRSCEDILEGLKPELKKVKATLHVSDSIEVIGDRYYVKATATLMDAESEETISNVAFARESDDKKGMDASQVTGATSSYARKYALNGLFLIDDTKDTDTDENKREATERAKKAASKPKTETKSEEQLNEEMVASVDQTQVPNSSGVTLERLAKLQAEMKRTGVSLTTILTTAKVKQIEDMNEETYLAIMHKLEKTKDKA